MSSSLSTPMTNPSLATPRSEEPADKWASSTLSALDPSTTNKTDTDHNESFNFSAGTTSTATTPGVNMPGGFPGSKSGPGIVQPDVEQVKGVAMSALETVQGYAASAAATATTAAQSAGDTVGQYLPESVKGYLPGSATEPIAPTRTLPSEETSQNVHPSSTGGVGTLPGPPGEAGVAVLPDERTGGVSTDKAVADALSDLSLNKSSPITTTTNNNPVSHSASSAPTRSMHTGFIPDPLAADSATSIGKLPEERRQDKLPSHEDESSTQLGKSGGVGKLPGSANESGVALLPDERKGDIHKETPKKSDAPSMASSGADTDASVKTLAGSRMGQSAAPSSTTKTADGSSIASGPGGVGTGASAALAGPQTQARQHPLAQNEKNLFEKDDGKFLKKDQVSTTVAPGYHTTSSTIATPGHGDTPFKQSSQDKPSNAAGAGGAGLAGAAPGVGHGTSSSPPKKHGFMDKVKGEMKVLSGKMSKDDTKIEEGKKMMGKN